MFFSTKNSSLGSSSICNCFVRVDSSSGFLSVEEFFDQLLNFGNSSRSSNQNNFVNISLLEVGIFENLLNRFQSRSEEIHVQFLELSSGKSFREVFSIEEGFDFNSCLMSRGQDSLCLFYFSPELLNCSDIRLDILSCLLLVQFDEVFHYSLIEILSSQVSVS